MFKLFRIFRNNFQNANAKDFESELILAECIAKADRITTKNFELAERIAKANNKTISNLTFY